MIYIVTGEPTSGSNPLSVQFIDLSSGATSWLWDFGDFSTSTDQNPLHVYVYPGTYTVSLTIDGISTETKTDYITVSPSYPYSVLVSKEKVAYIDVFEYTIKKAFEFSCVGWIKKPNFASVNPLFLMAVSNLSGNVVGQDTSIKMELQKDGGDFRLAFSNAKSKKIGKTLGIFLDDDEWHFISYVCSGEGVMSFYVDGITLPSEDGVSQDGLLYSIAWSRSVRQGGGDVWCPCLYEPGQAVSVYNWRFGAGVQIHQLWINELMDRDLQDLVENQL
jgi:hypothetical protein